VELLAVSEIKKIIGPLWSDGREYQLHVLDSGRVDVVVGGVVRASTYDARVTHLIGDVYNLGLMDYVFEEV
jgi:hypothetical protein